MFLPLHFSQRLPTVSFSLSFSSSSSSLHILHNSSTSPFFLYKNFPLLSFPYIIWFSHYLKTPLFSHFLSRLSSSLSMAPKAKKTSYILSSDAFLLTRWSGAMRLMEFPSLTHRLENHIPTAESVSPFLRCISPYPLEWSSEVDGVSFIDTPARESHPYGWFCKFLNFSHFQVSLWSSVLMCFLAM